MMENGKNGAFPRVAFDRNGNLTAWGPAFEGLTKREYFAAMAMQGCLANITQNYGRPNVNQESMEESLRREQEFIDDVASKAVRYSDALVRALETKPE